jgi:integrase
MKKRSYVFSSTLKDEICDFLKLRETQGRKDDDKYILFTLDTYLCKSGLDEKALSPDYIDGWMGDLDERIGANTKIAYISHYKQFAKYLNSINIPAFVPERPIGEQTYVPYVFSEGELVRLFEAADKLRTLSPLFLSTCIQFPIVLRILYGCGMRLGEVLTLKASAIEWETSSIVLRHTKGNKERLVPMDDSLSEVLRRYCDASQLRNYSDQLLFPNRKQEERTKAWASRCFKHTLRIAGIERPALPRNSRNICLHCIRHTFAVNSFRKLEACGIDNYSATPLLSVYMGHVNIYGTEKYLHMTAENSADIIEKNASHTEGLFPEVPQ